MIRGFLMPDVIKIGVLYGEAEPRIFEDRLPEEVPWRFEFYDHKALLAGPSVSRRDFLAVLLPADADEDRVCRHLATIFPGAELIGYRTDPKAATAETLTSQGGRLVLRLPLPFALARLLVDTLSLSRAHQHELAGLRRMADRLDDFFEALVSVMECSWSVSDRRLGMNLLIHRILAHVPAEECLVYLVGEDGTGLQRSYSTDNIKDIDIFHAEANATIVDNVLQTGSPYVNNSYSFELRPSHGREGTPIQSILCFPLQLRGERIGVIELINRKEGGFTAEDEKLIQMLIHPITVAVRTIHMFEYSERLTVTDDLTKVFNYRYLMGYLVSEVKRCLRYKKKLSLLFIDVDGFKRINDTFGHLVGSRALAELAQVFRKIVRETDIIGRYGGDEFVVILPETPLSGAMVIAERIRKKVEDYEFVAQNVNIRMTVSLGIANCPKHTLTAEGLIKKADAAMYRAKELSRNSIKVAV
ncbi:MAG: sensor diguanylate cyclase [Acidobacteria bacterium]|nr:sensor diguanylate cyclase [Acidobacteriota bacterium]